VSFGAVDAMAPLDPYQGPAYLAADATGALVIPPRSEFIAIFDRLLDPEPLEDPTTGAPPGLATITALAAVPTLTSYNPGGDSMFHVFLPEGPSFTVNPLCALPSGATGTVQLTMSSFLSRDGKTPVTLAPGVASAIAFQTQPLAVTIGVPPSTPDPAGGPEMLGTATPDTSITLQFNNLTPPGDPTALYFPCAYLPALPSLAPHIHVTTSLNGAAPTPVAAVITQNLMDTTQWVVAPPGTGADGTGGAWPDGAIVTISVDSGAVDVFNQPLSPTAPASFIAASPVAGSTP